MSSNKLQNYIKTRKWKGGFHINSSTTENDINTQSQSIDIDYKLDAIDSIFKSNINYTEIDKWVSIKTGEMPKNGITEIKRPLSDDEKPLKNTDNFKDYTVVKTSANRNDCLIHAFLTGVSSEFRKLQQKDKDIVASYFRRIILLWLVLHEPNETATIEKMKNELRGDIALQDDVIDYLAEKFKINIYYGFRRDGIFIWMLSNPPIDTSFIMIINPGAYHYETIRSPTNEYIFDYDLIKGKIEQNVKSKFQNLSQEEKDKLLLEHQRLKNQDQNTINQVARIEAAYAPAPADPPAPPASAPAAAPTNILYKRTYTAKISADMTIITVDVYYSLKIKDIDKIKDEILKLKPILMMSDASINKLQGQKFKPLNELTGSTYAAALTQHVNKVQYNYAIVKYLNDFLKVESKKQKITNLKQPYGEKTMEHIALITRKLSSTTAGLDKEYYKIIETINDILNLDNIDQSNLKKACTLFKQIHKLLITQYTSLFEINSLVSNNQGRLTGKTDNKYEYIRILYNELQLQEKIFSDNLHIINNILESYFSTCITSTLKKQIV